MIGNAALTITYLDLQQALITAGAFGLGP